MTLTIIFGVLIVLVFVYIIRYLVKDVEYDKTYIIVVNKNITLFVALMALLLSEMLRQKRA